MEFLSQTMHTYLRPEIHLCAIIKLCTLVLKFTPLCDQSQDENGWNCNHQHKQGVSQ